MTEPTKPEEPTQNGSKEPTEQDSSALPTQPDTPSSDNSQSDSEDKNDDEKAGSEDEFDPATAPDAQYVGGIIEEASTEFEFSKTTKFIAYLVGDALLIGALLVPDIVNTIQAPTASIWAEYMSKVLLEGGIAILTVFKLFKRKGK